MKEQGTRKAFVIILEKNKDKWTLVDLLRGELLCLESIGL